MILKIEDCVLDVKRFDMIEDSWGVYFNFNFENLFERRVSRD